MDTATNTQKTRRSSPYRRSDSNQHRNTILNPSLIERFLTTKHLGSQIVCFDELESTNYSAKELAKVGYPSGTLIVCDHQMSGRGRRDRKWVSIPGESLCMSLILRPKIRPELAPRYTIAAALGVYHAMALYCMHDVKIKWPNDIVFGNKKLAGILLDLNATTDGVNFLIIGLGLNVNTARFFGDLSETAVSIFQSTGVHVNRERVMANILNKAEPLFDMCQEEDGFLKLMEDYTRASAVYKRRVRIVKSSGTYEGIVEGFDPIGRICLTLDDGSSKIFDSGDVSLRYDSKWSE